MSAAVCLHLSRLILRRLSKGRLKSDNRVSVKQGAVLIQIKMVLLFHLVGF